MTLLATCYKTLNNASRYGDESKCDSLGPYAQVMNRIVKNAISKRKEELDEKQFKNLDLYRGTCLTLTQI
jgi:hypothetical protein